MLRLILALQLVTMSLSIAMATMENEIEELWQVLRYRPLVHIPKAQKYPKDLEEAKRWVKEAAYLWLEALDAKKRGKPKSVWQAYYQEAARLTKGVFDKFGEFYLIWLVPENDWGEFGDIILYPEQLREDYEEILKSNKPPMPIDPGFFYGEMLQREALRMAKQKGKKYKYSPNQFEASVIAILADSLYYLGHWREAMEALEKAMELIPWFNPFTFEKWIECATKVYRKGELPTKFLLVQNPKIPQTSSGGMSAQKMKGVALPLRFKNGHHYVPISRLSLFLGWKVEREGKEIFLKTQDREVKLTVGGRTAYVNGFKVRLSGFVWEEGKEVWLPLQFVAMIGKGKLKWEKGKGFIQMVLPE